MHKRLMRILIISCWAAALALGCAHSVEAAKPKAEDLYQQAIAADRSDKPDQAIDLLKQALAAKPKLKEAQLLLARLYADRGMYDEAIGHLKVAVQ